MGKKVCWDASEEYAVVDATARMRIEDPDPSLLQLFKLAMEAVLPKERWKFVKTTSAVAKSMEKVKLRILERQTEPVGETVPVYIEKEVDKPRTHDELLAMIPPEVILWWVVRNMAGYIAGLVAAPRGGSPALVPPPGLHGGNGGNGAHQPRPRYPRGSWSSAFCLSRARTWRRR